ncbi:MAG: VOC family protein [Planctomycetaceae bacterium]
MSDVTEHLYFTDVERALRFYTESLGFLHISRAENMKERFQPDSPQFAQPVRGKARVVRFGRTTVRLHASIPELAGNKQCWFPVEDVDSLYQELVRRGVPCKHPPRVEDVNEYGEKDYVFRVVDPEGHELKFWKTIAPPS